MAKRIMDKERLDWIGRRGHSVFHDQAWNWCVAGGPRNFPTIRQAIDAAIRASKLQGKSGEGR